MNAAEDEDETRHTLARRLPQDPQSVTHNLRYPSLTIHLSNFSRIFSSLGRSALISPDINTRVNGGHRDRSDILIDPELFLE